MTQISQDDIAKLYELACHVGDTLAAIRRGESDKAARECREEIDRAYDPLGKLIEQLYRQCGSPAVLTGDDLAKKLERWNSR